MRLLNFFAGGLIIANRAGALSLIVGVMILGGAALILGWIALAFTKPQ